MESQRQSTTHSFGPLYHTTQTGPQAPSGPQASSQSFLRGLSPTLPILVWSLRRIAQSILTVHGCVISVDAVAKWIVGLLGEDHHSYLFLLVQLGSLAAQ